MTSLPSQRRNSFPRGLVLGLTMAETAILIIFVLLLALTALLGREADRRRDAEQKLTQFQEIRSVLVERGIEPEGVLETIRNHATDRTDADNWRELVRRMAGPATSPTPEAIASRLDEAAEALDLHGALDDILEEAGVESTPEGLRELAEITQAGLAADLTAKDMRDAIASHRALQDSLREHGEETTPRAVQNLVADAQRWRELIGDAQDHDVERASQRIERLQAQVERLRTQVRGGGGTDHPSCWYDADGTVAYLFDVALMEAGFVLQPARAPQHEQERATLPTASIRTGQRLSPTRFQEQTREVFEWSVANECRFFVRAFDLTAPDQKEVYKDRMRTLESRFYKYANPSGSPPSVDPVPLRP